MSRITKLAIFMVTLSLMTAVAWGQASTKKQITTKNPIVVMKTSMGDIKVELYPVKAPVTVKNFLQYVDEKFYDGTVFHRVISNFMIQGGGFDEKLNQKKTRAPIVNEASNGLKNEVGTIAMARTPDPNSASAQFFINVRNNEALNYRDDSIQGAGYAVFGKVIGGMDVVNKIKEVPTGRTGMHSDVPTKTVIIQSIRRAN